MFRLLGVLALASCCVAPCGAQCRDTLIRLRADVSRLDGYPTPDKHPEVYREGFKIVLSPWSEVRGRSVTVETIRMDHTFLPGQRPEFAQRMNLDLIYGRGPAIPHEFHVIVRGAQVDRARWVKKDSAIEAKSGNFLDTDDATFKPFTLATSPDSTVFGTVLAANAGLYELVFRIGYRGPGGRGECRTSPIRMYQDYDT
jgi:hypothetical protein